MNRGSSDEIRADIERTRASMDDTFDALDQKLTPSQLLTEAWRYTKGGSAFGASKIWQLAREHPLPATMIGVGLGWLLVEKSRGTDTADSAAGDYRSYGYTGEGASGYGRYSGKSYNAGYESSYDDDEDRSSGRLASAAGAVKDAAGNAVDTVKDAAGNAVDTVKGAASTAREKVGDLTDTVKDRASHLSDEARHKATQLRNKAKYQSRKARTGFWQMMEQNPLAVGAATLTLGVIAGFSLPSTDKEDEFLGERRDQFLDTVKETGQEVLEKGRHIADAAVDKVKQEAEAQGLTPDNLVDKVKAVGREAKNAVTEEAKKQNLTGQGEGNTGANPTPASTPTTGGTITGSAAGSTTPGNQAGALSNQPVTQPEPELARK